MMERFFSEDVAKTIVNCIEEATGDLIKEDVAKNRLVYCNSIPARIWDYIFSNLTYCLQSKKCEVISTNSGPWNMAIIFDRTSGNIISIMREERFKTLKRQQSRRQKMHYLEVFAAALNRELLPEYEQISMMENARLDLHMLQNRIDQMLSDLGREREEIRNHVLVLFSSINYQLRSVRAIKVTPELEIAVNGEINLSKFITDNKSLIVDKISKEGAPADNPSRGLKLKKKALERKKHCERRKDNKKNENDMPSK